jgi:hypothetical protein
MATITVAPAQAGAAVLEAPGAHDNPTAPACAGATRIA